MTAHYAGRPPLPPGPPVAVPPPVPGAASAPPLYLIFGNQKLIVDKEQFIIGRGSKTSDLPIRDGNISRKHAAVIRRGNDYYIKDLGSTNGIDFNGERIEARKIEEGDVYSICDYQFRFTFR
jgi:pSer/pThr/pTyr-binding forkhead associated (FHA) protein